MNEWFFILILCIIFSIFYNCCKRNNQNFIEEEFEMLDGEYVNIDFINNTVKQSMELFDRF